MSLIQQISGVLRQHVGRENTVTSMQIAEAIGLKPSAERQIREAIADEDWESHELLVVAIPGLGYYVAADLEECNAYHALLVGLRDALNQKIKKFLKNCTTQGICLHKP